MFTVISMKLLLSSHLLQTVDRFKIPYNLCLRIEERQSQKTLDLFHNCIVLFNIGKKLGNMNIR